MSIVTKDSAISTDAASTQVRGTTQGYAVAAAALTRLACGLVDAREAGTGWVYVLPIDLSRSLLELLPLQLCALALEVVDLDIELYQVLPELEGVSFEKVHTVHHARNAVRQCYASQPRRSSRYKRSISMHIVLMIAHHDCRRSSNCRTFRRHTSERDRSFFMVSSPGEYAPLLGLPRHDRTLGMCTGGSS
jgi:hypothetical protein